MCLVSPADQPVKKDKCGNNEGNVLNPEHGGRAETREGSAEESGQRLQPQEAREIAERGGKERGREKEILKLKKATLGLGITKDSGLDICVTYRKSFLRT